MTGKPISKKRLSLDARYSILGAMLIAPTIIVFSAVIVYPLVSAIYLSVFSIYTPTMEGEWAGLDNYSRLLASGEFWRSLLNNLVWTAGTLTLQMVFGVLVALMLHQNVVFRSLARSLVLFPYFLSTVVAVLVWRWLFNDLYGVLNHMLMWAGLIDMPVDWLGSMPNAMISLIFVGAWKYFPFVLSAPGNIFRSSLSPSSHACSQYLMNFMKPRRSTAPAGSRVSPTLRCRN
jgi:multiple sugar transport system permease protein